MRFSPVKRLRVLTVCGTRPEAVKLAPVLRRMTHFEDTIDSILCGTGQQRDLLRQAFEDLDLRPEFDLDLMQPRQEPLTLCARAMMAIGGVIEKVRPEVVLVQGDTTSALAGALAAAHRQVVVGHVEAGLRSFNDAHPFPEEINRRLIDHVSGMLFAPTAIANANLLREGIDPSRVLVTGNTAIDTLVETLARLPPLPAVLKRTLLVTCHRRESFGDGVRSVCEAVASIAERYPDLRVVFITHPNPEAGDVARRRLAGVAGIELLPPLDYSELLLIMRTAFLVLTDSGGLQEEAPWLGKPVLVLREVTERPEGVHAGVARIVGTDAQTIVFNTRELLDEPAAYARMARPMALYGDGLAAERIVDRLLLGTGRATKVPVAFVPGERRTNDATALEASIG
jgi:UDP-N-acetylglucosamine 2-epimerase (non-hydrolysing)